MKKILASFLIICFVGFNNSCMAAKVFVPANTSIRISPIDTVTSKDKNVDNIDATIMEDIVINNTVVFRAGDKANLHIGEIEKAHCWGNPGKLVISNGYAYDVKGIKHKILLSKNYYGEERTWPKTLGVISIFMLWPLALFGFVHGGQATVSASSEIETTLSSQFYFEP